MTELSTYTNLLLDADSRSNYLYFDDDRSVVSGIRGTSPDILIQRLRKGNTIRIFRPAYVESAGSYHAKNTETEQIANGESIILPGSYRVSISTIRNMMTRDESFYQENGIRSMHLTLGMIQWRDQEISYQWNEAPLLMIPVSVHRDSSTRLYEIRVEGNRPFLNPAFAFKTEKEFGITLPAYTGGSFLNYAGEIGQTITPVGWKLDDTCWLALFQDHYLTIYRDLTENAELVNAHPVMRRFLAADGHEPLPVSGMAYADGRPAVQQLTGANGQPADAGTSEKRMAPVLHNVVDADASQTRAIRMAKSGENFVIQGPPGTGKSQTITNIIAECLYDGKTVLFVSAKRAALDFVYNKLETVGLNDFCLRIHGTKENRRTVTGDIFHSLQLPPGRERPQAEFDIARRNAAEQSLDAYVHSLHTVHPVIDKSIYQLFEIFAHYRTAPEVKYHIPDIYRMNEDNLQENLRCLSWYTNCMPIIGYDYRACYWYGFASQNSAPDFRAAVMDNFSRAVRYLDGEIRLAEEIRKYLPFLPSDTEEQMQTTRELVRLIAETDSIAPPLFREDTVSYALQEAQKLHASAKLLTESKNRLAERFDAKILSIDAAADLHQMEMRYASRLRRFGREYREILDRIQTATLSGTRPDYDSAVRILQQVAAFQEEEEAFQKAVLPFESVYGPLTDPLHTDWGRLEKNLRAVAEICGSIPITPELTGLSSSRYMALRHLCVRWNARFRDNMTSTGFDPDFMHSCLQDDMDIEHMPLLRLREWLQGCLDHAEQFGTWIHFLHVRDCLDDLHLTGFVDEAIADLVPAEQFGDAYCRVFYNEWIRTITDADPVLSGFSRSGQDQTVSIFSREDCTLFDINRKKIRALLSARRPSVETASPGEPVAELLREIQKSENPRSLREIIVQYADLLQEIMPCFMMSPMSVSTYLDPEKMRFDTVIFDEASQLLPQECFGAIYRSSQVIIVGDSQQMPPRDPKLQADAAGNDEPDKEDGSEADTGDKKESADTDDTRDSDGGTWLYSQKSRRAKRRDLYASVPYESILDLGCASLRQVRLLWHYRSRREGLIFFSNRLLYHDTLITFPSPEADLTLSSFGIEYHYIESYYDPNSCTNLKEAASVVNMVFSCIQQYPGKSIGVVATTPEQQTLISKLLTRRRARDTSAKAFFTQKTAEPFFIKNMETVQGDERDIIIISTVYAHTMRHTLPKNFGAISQKGGERRLNVMITRARYRIMLLTELHAKDLASWDKPPEGIRLFRTYLDYAERGPEVLGEYAPVASDNPYDTYIEDEICDFLEANGFKTGRHIGYSSARIDIGVRMPDDDHYFMAIECDGDTYRRAETAHDRDYMRREILQAMGWKYYRVWTAEWFRRHDAEMKALLKAVRDAAGIVEPPVTTPEEPEEDGADEAVDELNATTTVQESAQQMKQGDDVRRWVPPRDRL